MQEYGTAGHSSDSVYTQNEKIKERNETVSSEYSKLVQRNTNSRNSHIVKVNGRHIPQNSM